MQWISVEERLPDQGSHVWVYVEWEHADDIYIAEYPWRILDNSVADDEQEEVIARITYWFAGKETVSADIPV